MSYNSKHQRKIKRKKTLNKAVATFTLFTVPRTENENSQIWHKESRNMPVNNTRS